MADTAIPTVVTIESIKQRQSTKGKPYYTIVSGGEYYNCWDTMIVERLAEGQTYTLMITSKISGDKTFHNVEGIAPDELTAPPKLANLMPGAQVVSDSPAPTAPAPPAKPISPTPSTSVPTQATSMIDVRKTALSCATRLLAADMITMKGMNESLRKFENYILHGLSDEQIMSSAKPEEPDLSGLVANG